MQRIVTLALKDLKLMTRDKLGMFFMLAFPIMMALFFGSMMGGFGESGSGKLKVAVTDEDDSKMSAKFIEALRETESVDVTQLARDQAMDSVRKGDRVGIIILPKGFGKTAGIFWQKSPSIKLGLDPSRQAEAGMLNGLVMRSMGQLMSARFQEPGALKSSIEDSRRQINEDDSMPAAVQASLGLLMTSMDVMFDSLAAVQNNDDADAKAESSFGGFQLASIQQIDISRQAKPGSQAALLKKVRSGWDISFPQSMVWAILACVASFATLIVREQTIGTHTRLLVAPVNRTQLLAGKGLACFLCLVLVLLLITLFACVLGMQPRRWDFLALAIGCIAICFVGLMLPLSLLGRTEQAVSGAVWGVCTVMAMFGGGMMPVIFMPEFIQTISNYNPIKWAVYAMEGAIWRGLTFSEMLLPCGILVAFGIGAAALGSWMISKRQM